MKRIILSILASLLLVSITGCAAKAPPIPEGPQIPLGLLNYNPPEVVAPERPDATQVMAIKATDTPESALDTMIDYTADLGEYAVELEGQNAVLKGQVHTFKGNQTKIKQVIIMTQPPQ